MDLGARIEERIAHLGLTKAALAKRADVPPTTLSSIISRGSRSSPHLIKLARALETTPAYLTGEVDDPHVELPSFHVTAEERDWLNFTRKLSFDDRHRVKDLIFSLANKTHDAQGAAELRDCLCRIHAEQKDVGGEFDELFAIKDKYWASHGRDRNVTLHEPKQNYRATE